jgi:Tol biopolymer transport system component
VTVVPDTGGPAQTIYTGPQGTTGCKEVTWSSDGSLLAFVEVDMSTGEKYIKVIERATGTVTHTLVEGLFGTIEGLEWARQGIDELAFGGEEEGKVGFSLYILDIATGALELVRGGDQPSWSPDNSMLTFVAFGRGQPKIKTIDLNTGEVTTLATRGKLPDWRRF